jgi:hypothetical protein
MDDTESRACAIAFILAARVCVSFFIKLMSNDEVAEEEEEDRALVAFGSE